MSNTNSSEQKRHYVISEAELEPGERVITEIQGREIAVFNIAGEFHAVANYCVHQGGPACEGLLSGTVSVNPEMELSYNHEDEIVACPWHGWEFDVKTGEHLARPKYALPTYDVVTEEGEIYVAL